MGASTQTAVFAELARARAILLTTYKRDGTPVATPVWSVPHDGVLWITTTPTSGKAKRIRHNTRVLIAPCTQRGTVTGPTREGQARLMTPDETSAALAAIRRRYGLFDRLFSLINRLQGESGEIGIEIKPLA